MYRTYDTRTPAADMNLSQNHLDAPEIDNRRMATRSLMHKFPIKSVKSSSLNQTLLALDVPCVDPKSILR